MKEEYYFYTDIFMSALFTTVDQILIKNLKNSRLLKILIEKNE